MRRFAIVAALLVTAASGFSAKPLAQTGSRYEDLVSLFNDWRAFQKPKTIGAPAVPDYSAAAMAAQLKQLASYEQRLKAINPSAWPVPQQVDYHIVRAEMNGLSFDLRILQPWANDPAFYVTMFGDESDQPAREANYAYPSTELWSYTWPLGAAAIAEVEARAKAVPALLDQARRNLTGNGKDLWTFGVLPIRGQGADLAEFAAKLSDPATASLKTAIAQARAATDAFATWVEAQAKKKTGPSGVGLENYD